MTVTAIEAVIVATMIVHDDAAADRVEVEATAVDAENAPAAADTAISSLA